MSYFSTNVAPIGARCKSSPARTCTASGPRLLDYFDEHILPLSRRGYGDPALDKALCAIGDWSPTGTRVGGPRRGVPEELIPVLRKAAHEAVPELLP